MVRVRLERFKLVICEGLKGGEEVYHSLRMSGDVQMPPGKSVIANAAEANPRRAAKVLVNSIAMDDFWGGERRGRDDYSMRTRIRTRISGKRLHVIKQKYLL